MWNLRKKRDNSSRKKNEKNITEWGAVTRKHPPKHHRHHHSGDRQPRTDQTPAPQHTPRPCVQYLLCIFMLHNACINDIGLIYLAERKTVIQKGWRRGVCEREREGLRQGVRFLHLYPGVCLFLPPFILFLGLWFPVQSEKKMSIVCFQI